MKENFECIRVPPLSRNIVGSFSIYEEGAGAAQAMTLLVLPQLRVHVADDGRVTLTQKFISGMAEYVKLWPGSVSVLVEASETVSSNLDNVTLNPDELPFKIKVCDFTDVASMQNHFADAALILAGLDYRQVNLWRHARNVSVPLVYISEYSLKTRRQIIQACVRNPLRRVRKYFWENNLERQFLTALQNSAGVQCNGTPTYEAYKNISPDPLLYFDTRVSRQNLATAESLAMRIAQLKSGQPLRLVFSGRLTAIKGADHLPLLAVELKKRNVPFILDIFGGGDQESAIQTIIRRNGLQDVARLRGVIDFEHELVPYVRDHADLFVCCHRQGDPSCTYLETMSCGVPIVGYDNEAFVGVVRSSGVGWPVKMNDVRALADKITKLHSSREVIVQASFAALEFASHHTFEETMRHRVDHLVRCAGLAPALR